VRDSSGQSASGTVRVLVRPVAPDDTVATATGEPVLIDVLANHSGTGTTVTGYSVPAHGTVSISPGGTLTYTPNAGYSGVEILEYRVTDASGQTVTGTVTLIVAPRVMSDGETVKTGSSATMRLLSNDVGSGLSVTSHTQPGHGTVMVTPDGVATYTPTNGFIGTDTFAYTVTDASGQTVTGTVTVEVQLATLAEPTQDVLPVTGTDPAPTALFAVFLIVSGFLLFLGFPTRRGLHRA
jgi:hypothetical protein